MKKTTINQFHRLSRIECESITAGAVTATTTPEKSGGGTNNGTVNNKQCEYYVNNPPSPGTPEYQIYLDCLASGYKPDQNGSGSNIDPIP